ncbi:peptidylprolyl isomerase [Gilvimarinus sp. F26214L]|uniref:peptidyl-prolyl cis-trans isomerase n=1 Tax=Gilvimarinus sp. DZF01 TaxID=3461371 RepID=UPI0040457473
MEKPSTSTRLTRILKEPLTLFVVASVGIFALDAWRKAPPEEISESAPALAASVDRTIVISEGIVAALEEEFAWLEGRTPTPSESEAIVSQWLSDEIVFREAVARQMHMNDGKVREHLIEKVRLLWAGTPAEPSDQQLLAYYADNMDAYYAEAKVSFEQVFYQSEPDKPVDILARLRAGEHVEGDRYWLGDNMEDYAASILKTSFGGNFFNALLEAPRNEWIGPLASPRGYHYVRVANVKQPEPIPFELLQERIASDWTSNEQMKRVNEQTQIVRQKFEIIVEANEPPDSRVTMSGGADD